MQHRDQTQTLTASPKYRAFIADRDRALEQIHRNTQVNISGILNRALMSATGLVSAIYSRIPEGEFFTQLARNHMRMLEAHLETLLDYAANEIINEWMRMRRAVYVLAAASQTEAIAQAQGKPLVLELGDVKLADVGGSDTHQDESFSARVHLAMHRIKRKIIDAVEQARVLEEKLPEVVARVEKTFPKALAYKRHPRVLKPVKEADRNTPKADVAVVAVPDEEWDAMQSLYLQRNMPSSRFFNEPIDVNIGDPETEIWYAWEIEKELTQDFIAKVHAGDIEAANQAGIKDFVWIAVIDDKTDACCLWRDGLTIAEIQSQLKGEHRDDECQTVVPPAHFNCRCRLAPVGEVEDVPPSNVKDFDEWLNT